MLFVPLCRERLEYKYVVVSDRSGQVTWQPGGNLVLELGPGGGQVGVVYAPRSTVPFRQWMLCQAPTWGCRWFRGGGVGSGAGLGRTVGGRCVDGRPAGEQ